MDRRRPVRPSPSNDVRPPAAVAADGNDRQTAAPGTSAPTGQHRAAAAPLPWSFRPGLTDRLTPLRLAIAKGPATQ